MNRTILIVATAFGTALSFAVSAQKASPSQDAKSAEAQVEKPAAKAAADSAGKPAAPIKKKHAAPEPPVPLKVTGAWVRTTAPGASTAAVYMKLVASEPLQLAQVESEVAKSAEVHEMKMVDGVMQMRPIVPLNIPVGTTVELKPGSYHIMLLDIKKPIKAGQLVPVTLTLVNPENKLYKTLVAAVGQESATPAAQPKK